MYFVGVDGGTGDMECVVLDRGGQVRGRGKGGPSNDTFAVGRMHPDVARHLTGAIGQALTGARLSPGDVTAVSLNLSGDPDALTVENARAWLAPLGLADGTILAIEDDGLSAWAAGGFPDPAIWVLLGTNCGSGGMLDGEKVEHPLGSLDLDAHQGGPVGGAKIGSWALSAAVHSRLGGPPTRLFEACCAQLDVADLEGLVRWASEHRDAHERAELARAAAAAAELGDPAARELFECSAEITGRATVALARYMSVADREVTILLTGKAWRANERLHDAFRRTVLADLPRADIRVNELSQAVGAALLAMRHAGLEALTA